MKALLVLATLLTISGTAQAFESIQCKGNEEFGTSKNVTMTMKAVDKTNNDVPEGVKVPYELLVMIDNQVVVATTVQAHAEDVMFQFRSKTNRFGKVSGIIYLDELDQTSVTVNDLDFTLDCNSEE
ncbi:hypothetical protein D3C87_1093390 [compost metagenome]